MKKLSVIILLFPFLQGCYHSSHQSLSGDTGSTTADAKLVGGGCDGCELMLEGMPGIMGWIDTLPDWHGEGERMEVSGTVYRLDGTTPAEGIIIYFYHTDSKGYYSPAPEQSVALRHGHIRGWVKTNLAGQYKIYTQKPAPYPGATIPAHIHCTVKEPKINEYYIDEIEFDDDPLLNPELKREKRCGSGIVTLSKNKNGWFTCHRDIILGLNIPDYPR